MNHEVLVHLPSIEFLASLSVPAPEHDPVLVGCLSDDVGEGDGGRIEERTKLPGCHGTRRRVEEERSGEGCVALEVGGRKAWERHQREIARKEEKSGRERWESDRTNGLEEGGVGEETNGGRRVLFGGRLEEFHGRDVRSSTPSYQSGGGDGSL